MIAADLYFRIAGVTMLSFMAVLFLRQFGPRPVGLALALFCFGIAAYLLCPPMVRYWQLGVLELPFYFGCFGGALFFYLMSRAIFDDRFQFRLWHGGLLAVMEMLGGWHRLAQSGLTETAAQMPMADLALVLHQLLSLGITLAALFLAFQGKAIDLVELRRRFRGIFVGVSGAYILIVVVSEVILRDQAADAVLELINVAAIFVLCFAFAIAMTQLKNNFVVAIPGALAPMQQPADAKEEQLMAALTEAMTVEFIYRREGLTIGGLAEALKTQEYLLRRLINGAMGYRNFNEFLNKYRIEEVCQCLSDPELVKLPILSIAMDAGYSSLGPFNRAFKDITGMTPKAYRGKHLPGTTEK